MKRIPFMFCALATTAGAAFTAVADTYTGTAAAIALQSGTTPRALNPASLVATLKSDGVYLG